MGCLWARVLVLVLVLALVRVLVLVVLLVLVLVLVPVPVLVLVLLFKTLRPSPQTSNTCPGSRGGDDFAHLGTTSRS